MRDLQGTLKELEELLAHDAEAALARAERALAEVDRDADPAGARLALGARALQAQNLLGRYADSLRRSTELLRGELPSGEQASDLVRVYRMRGAAFARLGHDNAALETLEEAEEWCEANGAPHTSRVHLMTERASSLRRSGRTEQAVALFDDLLARGWVDDVPRLAISARLNAASALWQVGRADDAARLLDESAARLEATPNPELAAWQHAIRAWVETARGDHQAAVEHATRAEASSVDVGALTSAIRARALAQARLGDIATAERTLTDVLARCDAEGWPQQAVFVTKELAEVLALGGRFEEALGWMRDALERERRNAVEASAGLQEAEQERRRLVRARIEAERLRAHNVELAELTERLGRVSRDRARLLRTVSHDLRSPLTAMLCTIDLAERTDDTLRTIEEAAEQMASVIDGALSIEAILSGKPVMRPERLDLVEVCRRLVRGLSPLAERKSITVRIEAPGQLEVVTDPSAIGRVLENLITNALKFSPVGTEVVVQLEEDGGVARVQVRDRGPGLEADELGQIFEYQRTAAARPTGGESSSGLGLHIVHQLVRMLGGAVEATNADEGGAVFTVELPRKIAHLRAG